MNAGKDPETGESYVAPEKLKWFQNRAFRQAVAHSIDKDAIIEEVLHGLGYPQWASVSPAAGDFHNPNVRRYEYDADEANSILDGLGWTDSDGDGIREDDAGVPIEFALITNGDNSVRGDVTQRIRGGLGEDRRQGRLRGGRVRRSSGAANRLLCLGGHGRRLHRRDGIPMAASTSGTAARTCTCGIRARLNRRRNGRPRSTISMSGQPELDHDRRVEIYHRAQEVAAENAPIIYTTLSERAERGPERLRQHHAHAVRPVGRPLLYRTDR